MQFVEREREREREREKLEACYSMFLSHVYSHIVSLVQRFVVDVLCFPPRFHQIFSFFLFFVIRERGRRRERERERKEKLKRINNACEANWKAGEARHF